MDIRPREEPIPPAWRGVFEPLEAGSIATLRRYGACFETAIAAALAIRAEAAGDAYFDLHDYADQIATEIEGLEPTRWPSVEPWLAAMHSCIFAAVEAPDRSVRPPLAHDCAIVLYGTHVYLRRVWRTESDLAARLLRHIAPSV